MMMTNKINPIPTGYHSVTPYLFVKDAANALTFYKNAFNAVETVRLTAPTGTISHAEIKIGDSLVMLADEYPPMNAKSPHTIGGTPVFLHLYVENVDQVFQRAIAAGATEQYPLANQFYGDRTASVIDPFGHVWHIASRIEELTPDEIYARFNDLKQEG